MKTKKQTRFLVAILCLAGASAIQAEEKPIIEYPYAPYNEGKLEPQLTGWPLSAEEKAYLKKPANQRRPGSEGGKSLPEMWSVTPMPGYISWSSLTDTVWFGKHERLMASAKEIPNTEIVLLGDAFTQRWGDGAEKEPLIPAWQKQFAQHKTLNFGITAERTENLLWRLDHGALDGLSPKVVVLNIGMNNVSSMKTCGVTASSIAQGIALCVENIRKRVPTAHVVVVTLLPTDKPGSPVRDGISKVNAALNDLQLDKDPMVQVLDLTGDLTNKDGTLRNDAYAYKHIYLGDGGYEIYAARLKTILNKLLTSN